MNDSATTVRKLRDAVQAFVDEREWRPFHDPKNLAMSIAIEAAELMEHFQWLRSHELAAVRESADDMQQIREELADIVCYLLSFANAMDIDVTQALTDKLKKNEIKYPADRFRGRFR
ncbi:MAG: nucleotide pyrophosphohydrolase [Phycisphaerae bacterium]